jgi:L-ascorbate metabolism protein UlaG (beta-lactamase superfamily)
MVELHKATAGIIAFVAIFLSFLANNKAADFFQHPNGAIESFDGKQAAVFPLFHGTVMLQFGDYTVYVDPVSPEKLEGFPKANLILVTHHHGDHLNVETITKLSTDSTIVICNGKSAEKLPAAKVMANSDKMTAGPLLVEAVPAYNLVREREPGVKYHPKGEGNGYVLSYGSGKIYIAGDTENVPEMANLKNITIAFLPVNLPYTMTPEDLKKAVEMFKPKIVYPYHQGSADMQEVARLLKDVKGVEARILPLP